MSSSEDKEILEYSFDLETTAKSKYPLKKNGKPFGAWPFHPDNRIVMAGYTLRSVSYAHCNVDMPEYHWWAHADRNSGRQSILYTQAGKFDLLYGRLRRLVNQEFLLEASIWDTQIAEYVLTGQQAKAASMDEMAVKYGLPIKKSKIKEYYEAGLGADDIYALDPELLKDYQRHDVETTLGLAKAQQALATPKQMALIFQMGEAMKAIADMEYNGLEVRRDYLESLEAAYEEGVDRSILLIVEEVARTFGVPEESWAMGSPKFWSAYIFGGEFEFKWQVPNGFWKSGARLGQTRYKNETKTVVMPGLPDMDAYKEATEREGIYKLDEDVLEHAAKSSSLVYKYKGLKKEEKILNTYIRNILLNVSNSYDGRLHPNFNQTLTGTGRLSCSNPNMQNMPSDALDVRSAFVSRFGKEGKLYEFDWTALEMVGFATINPDKQLIKDLNDGVDPHTETGKVVYGPSHGMTEKERVGIKGVNFGTIYGGGATTIGKQSGLPVHLVKKIQKAFRGRYHEGFAVAQRRAELSVIDSPTGRRYVTDGKYTAGMNHPVQGFATGDLVPTVMGRVWRELMSNENLREKCLTINQEHDKLTFDIHNDVAVQAVELIIRLMEGAPQIMRDTYGVQVPCRTPVKVKFGDSLGSVVKLDREEFDKFGTIREQK